jgi:hypothetical protein
MAKKHPLSTSFIRSKEATKVMKKWRYQEVQFAVSFPFMPLDKNNFSFIQFPDI